jgi:predicted RNA-binding Zn-ribbon protein involved in translation (DUF1610 family)
MRFDRHAICSNPSCKFNVQAEPSMIKGCPVCGNKLIYDCPHCKEPILFKPQTHCTKCLKPLKSQPKEIEVETRRPRKKGIH